MTPIEEKTNRIYKPLTDFLKTSFNDLSPCETSEDPRGYKGMMLTISYIQWEKCLVDIMEICNNELLNVIRDDYFLNKALLFKKLEVSYPKFLDFLEDETIFNEPMFWENLGGLTIYRHYKYELEDLKEEFLKNFKEVLDQIRIKENTSTPIRAFKLNSKYNFERPKIAEAFKDLHNKLNKEKRIEVDYNRFKSLFGGNIVFPLLIWCGTLGELNYFFTQLINKEIITVLDNFTKEEVMCALFLHKDRKKDPVEIEVHNLIGSNVKDRKAFNDKIIKDLIEALA